MRSIAYVSFLGALVLFCSLISSSCVNDFKYRLLTGITVNEDKTAPVVSAIQPENGATNVSSVTVISVNFSKPLNTATVQTRTSSLCAGTLQVSADDFISCVAMTSETPAFNAEKTIATITPASPLLPLTLYKIRILPGIADLSGNSSAAQTIQTIGFRTQPLTIIYVGNGNNSGTPPVDGNTYSAGNIATVLAPGTLAKTGEKFVGWNTLTNGSGTVYLPGAQYTMTSQHLVLYASYKVLVSRNYVTVASSSNGNVLLAGDFGGNLWVSTNAGATWVSRESNRRWNSVGVSSDGSKMIAVPFVLSGSERIYVSNDTGTTWNPVGPSSQWRSAAVSGDGVTYYAGRQLGQASISYAGSPWVDYGPSGIWADITAASGADHAIAALLGGKLMRTTNHGINWIEADGGGTGSAGNRNWIGTCMHGTLLSYAGVTTSSSEQIYFSANSGSTWNWRGPTGNGRAACAIPGFGATYIFITSDVTNQIGFSSDSGVNWSLRGPSLYWRDIAVSADGKQLIAAGQDSSGDNFLYTSVDSGVNWTARN